MQQLTAVGPSELEWQEVAEPELEAPTDALVRPLVVAACDVDRAMIEGRGGIPTPIALGHEFVGEVTRCGDEVVDFSAGARVVVPFQIACGHCDRCQAKQTHCCQTVPTPAMFGFGTMGGEWGGALSDAVRVPFADQMLVEVPEGVDSAAVASAGDNIADAWRTVAAPLNEAPGAAVLVLGSGQSIGLYAVQIALALGAREVTYLDMDSKALALADSFGAEAVEARPERYREHPIVVDASWSKKGLACALRSMAPGGICTSTSSFFEPMTPLPLAELFPSGTHLKTGMAQARPVLPAIMELVATGRLQPELVTSRIVGWDEAPEALLEPEIKLVINRGEGS